ncbi:condensation domain-containing protein [Microbulbifer sp. VAAF005]|uniref:condensation domain-containing protein n=1 Tax=Microbulbifer sp. VAAF005 TaxID=3034230 RepID=UPI0024ADA06D|nr:condensation domain-containing protein [Microbulbifer sp. VAAF005]WHI46531.1 condensation domain-containing protein [Microbulbifer sp. VAAF005]
MAGWSLSTQVPLSITEQRIYDLHHRKDLVDLITRAMVVKGDLDVELFKKSISEVVNTYPIFRCRYSGEPAVRSFVDIELDYLDIRHLSEAHVASFLRQFGSSPINLERDQLLGLSLLRTGEDEYIFLTKCHHIITDGISLSLLWSEALSHYLSGEVGKDYQPRVETTDFADYVNFEQAYLLSARGQKARDYWQDRLQIQEEKIKQLPQSEETSVLCSEAVCSLGEGEIERVMALASSENVSLFAYLAAAFQQVLCEFLPHTFWMSGNLSLRLKKEHREVFGPMCRYVNLMVCRDEPWHEKLARLSTEIKYAMRTVYAAESIGPHGRIGHHLDASHCYLVTFLQTEEHREGFFAVYTGETSDWARLNDHLKIRIAPLATRLTPYGIYLSITVFGKQLRSSFIYNENCFEEKQVEAIVSRWCDRLLCGPEDVLPQL